MRYPSDILIGLDLGTSVLKAAAYDASTGRMLATSAQNLPVALGRDGARQQDAKIITSGLWRAMVRLRHELAGAWGRVAGIGLAAQGGSAVIVDRASGQVHSPLYLWNDMRFVPYLPRIQRRKTIAYWRKLSWRDEPGWGLARMLWMRQAHPKWFGAGNLYAGAGDVLFFLLTGQWRQDAGNALQEGCYNVGAQRLDSAPLRLARVDLSFVSPLRQGHQTEPLSLTAAKKLGLRSGLPVAGPYMDHEAGYMAAAVFSPRPLQLSLGTAWVGNFVLPAKAQWVSPFQLVVPSPVGMGKLVVQPLLTGNVTWDWALATLFDRRPQKALALADQIFAESLLPPDGLVVLPWLNMPNPLRPQTIGAAVFHGISATTNRAELLRAIALAMVYEVARVFAEVVRLKKVDAVMLTGGASHGRHFQQLLAAALAPLPVRVLLEQAWAGTRGVLHPLGLTKQPRTRIPALPSKAELRHRLRDGFGQYMDLFNRSYGSFPSGGAIRFRLPVHRSCG